jgi:Domain of unknown function (DUF4303)
MNIFMGTIIMTGDREEMFVAIRNELLQAAKSLLSHLRSDRPDEHLYGFFFMTSREGSYAHVSAGTEETLTRTAEYYKSKGYRAREGDTINLLRTSLRWTCPEDGWHGLDGPYCDKANELIASACKRGLIEYFDGTMERLCLQTLNDLDSSGAFGGKREREKIVLGLSYGDQSDEEYLSLAIKVNPSYICNHYRAEIEAARVADELLIVPPHRRPDERS